MAGCSGACWRFDRGCQDSPATGLELTPVLPFRKGLEYECEKGKQGEGRRDGKGLRKEIVVVQALDL